MDRRELAYAARHRAPAYTGSIGTLADAGTPAVPGEDGYIADDGTETSPPVKTPAYLGGPIKLPNEDRFAVH